MKTFNAKEIAHDLLKGKGYHVVENLFSKKEIKKAKDKLIDLAKIKAPQISKKDSLSVISATNHIWNLIDKDEIFRKMVQNELIVKVFSIILGNELKLGSFAARIQQPGDKRQKPHLDYPYWDMYNPKSFPININSSFAMNCQSTIMIDDFTLENGATMVGPGTQLRGYFPKQKEFWPIMKQATGRAGSVILTTGLLWHGAGANNSKKPRIGILGQYLPKFVKPMEDQLASVDMKIIKKSSKKLQNLLGVNYPYPQVLDTSKNNN
jgi:ectoine hydroxylase-related dioxygenase (phytanoyl-CoA dioxygenase family)